MSGRGSEEQIPSQDRAQTTQTPRARQERAQTRRHRHQGRGQGRRQGPRGGARAARGGGEREIQGGRQGRALQELAGKRENQTEKLFVNNEVDIGWCLCIQVLGASHSVLGPSLLNAL